VITRKQLIQDICGDDAPDNVRYLRTLVRKLRQKLEADPSEPKLLISESGWAIAWSARPRIARTSAVPARRPRPHAALTERSCTKCLKRSHTSNAP
jgi:hypothetical protein